MLLSHDTCQAWWGEARLTHIPFGLQETGCTEHICMGSIMLPSHHIRKSEDVRTKDQLFPLAKEFLDQYYSSIKRQVQGARWLDPWANAHHAHVMTWVQILSILVKAGTCLQLQWWGVETSRSLGLTDSSGSVRDPQKVTWAELEDTHCSPP